MSTPPPQGAPPSGGSPAAIFGTSLVDLAQERVGGPFF
jgi:hypothetical protein